MEEIETEVEGRDWSGFWNLWRRWREPRRLKESVSHHILGSGEMEKINW